MLIYELVFVLFATGDDKGGVIMEKQLDKNIIMNVDIPYLRDLKLDETIYINLSYKKNNN